MRFFTWLRERWDALDHSHNFTCDVCGREVFGGERICAACKKTLPYIRRFCPVCGRRVREEGVCAACKQRRPVPDAVRSCFLHEGDAARLVRTFKRGERWLAITFAEELAPILRAFPAADALIPVPMTARALKKRGFDQTLRLAKELSRLTGVPVVQAAVKQRETAAQKSLTRREREKNLAGCFHIRLRKEVRGRAVVIIDDTYTTGATVDELAAALRRAGAAAVYALTVTSVEDKFPFGKKDG